MHRSPNPALTTPARIAFTPPSGVPGVVGGRRPGVSLRSTPGSLLRPLSGSTRSIRRFRGSGQWGHPMVRKWLAPLEQRPLNTPQGVFRHRLATTPNKPSYIGWPRPVAQKVAPPMRRCLNDCWLRARARWLAHGQPVLGGSGESQAARRTIASFAESCTSTTVNFFK
jgi:hypothetical protein